MSSPLLDARGISKSFPGVRALQSVNLRLERGEVLAVVGENGAGKSTLMKILAGVEKPDAGELHLEGAAFAPNDVAEAQRQGVVLIHQELNLAENLDVAGNIFLGREPRWGGPLRLIDRRRMHSDAAAILRRLGFEADSRTSVGSLSIGQQQLVEIARALSLNSRVLIMDEPTSSLAQRESERLFDVIRDLRTHGIGILYISHRLKEVEEIADRVEVLRDGRNAGSLESQSIRHDAMVRLMVGRELKQFFQRTRSSTAENTTPLLRVSGLRLAIGSARSINFSLRAGEVVGLAGLMGSGRSELGEALCGVAPPLAGDVELSGQRVSLRTPADAIRYGIYLLPEDRRSQGLVLAASVKHNITLPSLDRLSVLGLIARGRETELAKTMCGQLNVRTPSTDQTVGLLSGGNQQKVVLAKWLARSPRVLILDEPTRGIDVGAKTEIYGLIDRLANQGVAILMISSDLEEILGMSDRVLVMHQGTLAGELQRESLSEESIMHLATGGAARQ
jgi:ribose transport system ATP-binding protein